jgi:two-component system, OmpR family, alkaline phosphatase synthesis response regulator PhoP
MNARFVCSKLCPTRRAVDLLVHARSLCIALFQTREKIRLELMKKRILIVEDEEALCITLGDRLRREGYEVDFAFDGSTGLEMITTSSFDLIILDVMLPSKNGLDLCMEARRDGITTPILFLTARSQTVDRIIGLKLGGDDYLAKPFDSMELLAHVEALLRFPRTSSGKASAEYVQFESMTLDLRKGQIHQNGNIISLTTKEFQLLRYFTEHPGVTISREELLSHVWDLKPGTMTRTVDMHIASLRQKLESSPKNPQIIETVPHLGYRFTAEVKPLDLCFAGSPMPKRADDQSIKGKKDTGSGRPAIPL